ncbi:MAG TPA: hypothetical protein VJ727_02775 [Rhodanobacteraceae bacterium]|nr:hypothetical protein [Rhodanobacteraceae bacterium]
MKRALRNRLLLLCAVIALVALVLWFGWRDQQRTPLALTDLDPDSITRIELTIAQGAPQVFEKRDGHWWRTAPTKMRGNNERVQRLANLAATPVARWVDAHEFDPAKVGLASPSATLVLDGVSLRYGALSALDELRYVQINGRVALVSRQYSPEITLAMQPAGH